jgi:Arc/MetJ-type ribon-helix-helix transcriptional regulator
MNDATVTVKFPTELDAEIQRFVEDTGLYTNKSEFVRQACRSHLQQLDDDPTVAALRLRKLLARAERSRASDETIRESIATLAEKLDTDDVERAVEEARIETAEKMFGEPP